MKIRELLESKYDYSLADYESTPYDPGFDHYEQGRKVSGISDEPHIGPQEGKNLNLMLKGIKPAAAINNLGDEMELFKPYIEKGIIKLAAKGPGPDAFGHQLVILTLPGEEWRGPPLIKMFQHVDVDGKLSKTKDAKIGMLLGLPKESIRYYLKTRH
jgi:hypothetical protein